MVYCLKINVRFHIITNALLYFCVYFWSLIASKKVNAESFIKKKYKNLMFHLQCFLYFSLLLLNIARIVFYLLEKQLQSKMLRLFKELFPVTYIAVFSCM